MLTHAARARARIAIWALGFMVIASVIASTDAVAGDAITDGKATYRVDDASLVYLGNARLFKKPCEVSTDRVYRAIPEYREILDKNLTEKDVRYHFLLKKATEKFAAAVKDVARDQGYDLVAGSGAVLANVDGAPAVPDATDAAIQRLPV